MTALTTEVMLHLRLALAELGKQGALAAASPGRIPKRYTRPGSESLTPSAVSPPLERNYSPQSQSAKLHSAHTEYHRQRYRLTNLRVIMACRCDIASGASRRRFR